MIIIIYIFSLHYCKVISFKSFFFLKSCPWTTVSQAVIEMDKNCVNANYSKVMELFKSDAKIKYLDLRKCKFYYANFTTSKILFICVLLIFLKPPF